MRTRTLAACVTLLLTSTQALAQQDISIRGYGSYGSSSLTSSESFDAVTGSSRDAGFGGGVTASGLWRGIFLDAGVSQLKMRGERLFVDGTDVYRLGIPLTVTLTPVDVAAGWRFHRGRLSPFVGGGISSISYKESGEFAEAGDDVSRREIGPLLLAGVDVRVIKLVHVGGEFRYRSVKGLGEGGVSQVFGEDALGGMSVALRLSVGR